MPIKYLLCSALLIVGTLTGCNPPEKDPNILYSEEHKDPIKELETDKDLSAKQMPYQHTFYVPIYSNIYVDEENEKILLSATLSIRNTSQKHNLYITRIHYYNTKGDFVRSYLEKAIELPPMGTLNYIVEKHDDTGGDGANFMVDIESTYGEVAPKVEAVMIGNYSNKGFAFNTQSSVVPSE